MAIADWITAASLFLGVVAYVIDKLISRKERTSAALQQLFDDYYLVSSKQDNYLDLRRYLGKVERLCIGIKSFYYSKRTVKEYGSNFLTMLYDKYNVYVIEKTRKDFKDDTKFNCFETLIKKWKKA